MKKIFVVITLAVLSLAACKKDGSTASASFTTNKSNYYLQEKVTINNTSTGGSTYAWDFGDGQNGSGSMVNHTYAQSGIYNIKLTVNGSAVASKTIRVYTGTASYQVENTASISLPLVSFSTDANNNLIDFQNDGTIVSGAISDTVFTSDSHIYIGGTLPNDSLFIATYPHQINMFTNNVLVLADTSKIFINNLVKPQGYKQFFNLKTISKSSLSQYLNAVKQTAQ